MCELRKKIMVSNKYKDMLLELLSLEEKNDIFNLTREKRSEFQNYIKEAIRIMEEFPSVQERIADMKPEAFYACGNWGLFKEGYEDARDKISDILENLYG